MNETHDDSDRGFAILYILIGIAMSFVMVMILYGMYFGALGDLTSVPFEALAWLMMALSAGMIVWGARTLQVVGTRDSELGE
jgi:phosphate/sulfate permease